MPVNKKGLLDSVQKILSEDCRLNPFTDNRPGDGWFNAFLTYHPEIAKRKAKPICRSRDALTEKCIRGWFRDTVKFFNDNNCDYILNDPSRQYNGDETGFQLDSKTGHVLDS